MLPVAGTYTIFFDPRTNSVGSHTVPLYTVPADATNHDPRRRGRGDPRPTPSPART